MDEVIRNESFKYGYYESIWCYVGFGISYSVSRCHPKARNHSFYLLLLSSLSFCFSSRLPVAH